MALRSEQSAQQVADAVYDPQARSWSELPADPMAPSFTRSAVQTPRGLLVTGAAAVPNPGTKPLYLRASLLDVEKRTWQRLPDSEHLVGVGPAVHGDRAVWPDLGGADGGEVNGYGRWIPSGGVLDLATPIPRPDDGPASSGAAGWAGPDLVVVGGTEPRESYERVQGAWVLRGAGR